MPNTDNLPGTIPNQKYLRFWCQKILPAVYDDSLSYYELLNKVVHYLNETIKIVNQNADATNELLKYVEGVSSELEILKDEMEKWKNGDYISNYIEALIEWINTHLTELISRCIKQVYFGLNDAGYFVAFIPDSWSDITFDTGFVFGRTDYGRLILRFEADHAIDNTYSYCLAQPTCIQKLIADLEVDAKRTDACFDTLFTNLDQDVILNANI